MASPSVRSAAKVPAEGTPSTVADVEVWSAQKSGSCACTCAAVVSVHSGAAEPWK